MKNYYLVFLFSLFSFSFGVTSLFAQVNIQDSMALVAFNKQLDGDNWNTKWDFAKPVSHWIGVRIVDQRVHNLSLYNNNLVGQIPAELGSLSELRLINLGSNHFVGNLPTSIQYLDQLTRLYIQDSELSGIIPDELGYLDNLTHFSLRDNNIEGEIPASLGMLSNLKAMYLDGNQLTGSVPRELKAIDSLLVVNLTDNQLSGRVPEEFGDTDRISKLRIGKNKFSFEDIVPHMFGIEEVKNRCGHYIFEYIHQEEIPTEPFVELYPNQSYTFHLDVDHQVYNNVYQWFKDGDLIATNYTNSFTIHEMNEAKEGIYTCEITNAKAPRLILHSTPTTISLKNGIGQIEEPEEIEDLIAYPNPTDNVLNINFNSEIKGNFELTMTDVLGRKVYRNSFDKKEFSYKQEINVKNYAGGVYILEIKQNDYQRNKKITVVSR